MFVSLSERSTISSAYNKIDILVELSKNTGMPQFNDSIARIKSFTNALKNWGDKTHPCFNPIWAGGGGQIGPRFVLCALANLILTLEY